MWAKYRCCAGKPTRLSCSMWTIDRCFAWGGAVSRAGRRTGTTGEGQRDHSAGGQGGATGGGG
eukprot:751754-Prorocentrum_minimum.AAC.2